MVYSHQIANSKYAVLVTLARPGMSKMVKTPEETQDHLPVKR